MIQQKKIGIIMALCLLFILTSENVLNSQSNKDYVPIISKAKKGDMPLIKISPLILDLSKKQGSIPFDVIPYGFWKSRQKLDSDTFDLFEFNIMTPSHTIDIGEPNIPVSVLELDIPVDSDIDSIDIKTELLKTIDDITLVPNQEPLPIDDFILQKQKIKINSNIYEKKEAYPGKYYEVLSVGFYGDRKIAIIKTYPAQFYPGLKKVEFYRLTGVIKLNTEGNINSPKKRILSDLDTKELLTPNLNEALTWKSYERSIEPDVQKSFNQIKNINIIKPKIYNCIIITADLFFCPAKDLAAHHTAKGIPTYVVTVNDIIKYIPGADSPEKIRKFIKIAYTLFRVKWIILFGDVKDGDPGNIINVPTRFVADPAPYTGVDDGIIPCDFYYSCLDGNWDANGNGKYGESDDKPDLLPEIYVGRIPTNNLDDAQAIVDSIIKYENAFPAVKGGLIAANDLGWGGHEIVFKNGTYAPILSGYYANITKMYQGDGTLTLDLFKTAVNNGIDFIQYYGHGSPTSTQLMTSADVKNLLKYTKSYPVMFSLSCSTSRYDNKDCFGEAWIVNRIASSYAGSTRVAYGSLSTGEGLDIRFIQNFKSSRRTGYSLDVAKYQLFRDFGWDATTLKTILEFTLFGDPIMLHVK
jgi:hypothetical protein